MDSRRLFLFFLFLSIAVPCTAGEEAPSDPRALRLLADRHYASGEPVKAFAYYKKLVRTAPPELELFRRFGDAAVNAGAYDEARLAYKRALREAVRQRNAAETAAFKKMIRVLPAFTARIGAMIDAENYESAYRELRKFLARNPTHPWAIVEMGRIYEKLGRRSQARSLFEQAVRWHDEDAYAHYALANFYLMQSKEFDKALKEYKIFRARLNESIGTAEGEDKQKRMAEYSRDATRSIVYLYLEILQEPKMAVAELESLRQGGGAEQRDLYTLGAAYLKLHKRTSAYSVLQKAIEADPKSETAEAARALIESVREESREGFAVEA